MKLNKNVLVSLIVLSAMASLYRVFPGRPVGFAPQIAIALFSGALFVNNKKWAFMMPLLSMFISDLLYQVLYTYQLTPIRGFYGGQWQNYLLLAALAVIGFAVNANKVVSILGGVIAAPTVYFLVSNFMVWMSGGGWHRPKTMAGLTQCYADGLPFYQNSVLSTGFFAILLFGGYYVVSLKKTKQQLA